MSKKAYDKKREDVFNSFTELCHYAEEYHLVVELEKPFQEMEGMILKLIDEDGETKHRATLDNIGVLNEQSASLLNELSKTKH